ncbi:MAG: glycine cleavage system protein H, partial [Planctomycetota bacterium]
AVDVFTPVAGTLVAVNEELFENPDLLTDDPYDEGWLFVVSGVDAEEVEELLDPKEYQAAVELAEAE